MSHIRLLLQPQARHLSRYVRPFRRDWLPITSMLNDMQRVMRAFDEDMPRDRYMRRQRQDDDVQEQQQQQQQRQQPEASNAANSSSESNVATTTASTNAVSDGNSNQVAKSGRRDVNDSLADAWDPFDFGFGFPSVFSRRTMPAWARQELQTFNPRFDVVEEDKQYRIAVELPGVRKEDVKIRLGQDGYGGRTLTISGERRNVWGDEAESDKAAEQPSQAASPASEGPTNATATAPTASSEAKSTTADANEQPRTQVRGVSYGSFSRTISLPEDVDVQSISAKQDHGILRLTLPKFERPAAKEQEITVQ